MNKLFLDTRVLDKNIRESCGLSEEIMMENAAGAIEKVVAEHTLTNVRYISRPTVLVLCGSGNNGADGYALARRLISHKLSVVCCQVSQPKSELCKIQKLRAEKIGVRFIDIYELDSFLEEKSFDLEVIVDCIFGSGLRLPLSPEAAAVIESVNKNDAYKVACDVPTGLDENGNGETIFFADETVTMGALKYSLYSDIAKDFVGKISVANLGISRDAFETETFLSHSFVLEYSDAVLPVRKKQNVNKGSFGHAAIISGEKAGAAQIASFAALNFGVGLVTMVGENKSSSAEIMSSEKIPENISAIAIGMGLGRNTEYAEKYILQALDFAAEKRTKFILDADICYSTTVSDFLEKFECVITPHPKEFSALLKSCGIGDVTVNEILKEKTKFAKEFCEKYKKAVLLLKGANTMIASWSDKNRRVEFYINPIGTAALAKGGSGDVLAGLISALLAQGYNTINAAVTASLVHGKLSTEFKNNFSLSPLKLISRLDEVVARP